MLTQTLSENGFTTSAVASAAQMEPVLERGTVDLVILDVMLPGEDGFSICHGLRATSRMPIIMLTALGEDVNRIVGLEVGADDYVTKLSNSRELIVRIRELLRRSREAPLARGRSSRPPLQRVDDRSDGASAAQPR